MDEIDIILSREIERNNTPSLPIPLKSVYLADEHAAYAGERFQDRTDKYFLK
jgi:hypothetical protein